PRSRSRRAREARAARRRARARSRPPGRGAPGREASATSRPWRPRAWRGWGACPLRSRRRACPNGDGRVERERDVDYSGIVVRTGTGLVETIAARFLEEREALAERMTQAIRDQVTE